ncbi:DUF1499 domain-containing protein [Pelagibacterium xiamenense]|uniref:DUF1499 domain-containing protein n=1 Tax=Pelagibacterium xiamenense TaxID=2901140 RepID=UPI001E31C086|nr:DUF1499 domain-containing protein [Pelagibacterium xiamenense]MCD7059347.1 DUF1499 domain-containing protein [Pelagibacterium xiamenense]
MRVFVRTSKLAIWARRLGTFGVPLLVLAILLHVLGHISTDVFEVCLAIATVAGGLAVLLALAGYVRLWFTGDKGWGLASAGLLTGALCILPVGAALALMAVYPSTADISTDPRDPPELTFPRAGEPQAIDPDLALEAFPRVLSRSYRIDPVILYGIVRRIAEDKGWQVMGSQGPQTAGDDGRLNAIRKSLLGWSNEVAVRIEPAPLGAQLDIRGASVRDVQHDLGSNGLALESFLVALDQAVADHLRNNVQLSDAFEADIPADATPIATP